MDADDIIATLATRAAAEGFHVDIMSTDEVLHFCSPCARWLERTASAMPAAVLKMKLPHCCCLHIIVHLEGRMLEVCCWEQ